MQVMTAHKILISTAAVFFLFYSGWEMVGYLKTWEFWALPRGLVALLVALALGAYFTYLRRKRTPAALAEGLTKPRKSA